MNLILLIYGLLFLLNFHYTIFAWYDMTNFYVSIILKSLFNQKVILAQDEI